MHIISNDSLAMISGGANCIDVSTWNSLNNQNIRDGVILSSIVTTIASGFVYGITDSYLSTGLFFATAAPYVAIYGYLKADNLKIFEGGAA